MSAVKSGNNISVSGTGNTLASITTDINDTTFIEKVSTTPPIYVLKGNTTRNINILNGGVLTIGNASDYSFNEELRFENLANSRNGLTVNAGGTLNIYGNVVIDCAYTTGYYPNAFAVYGKFNMLGDDDYQPIIKHQYYVIFGEYANNNSYPNDIWTMNKCKIGSSAIAGYYQICFDVIGVTRNHSFSEIKLDRTIGRNLAPYRGISMLVPFATENMALENIDFYDCGTYGVFTNVPAKYKSCGFGTTTSYKIYFQGTQHINTSIPYTGYNISNPKPFRQEFHYLEDCVFADLGYKRCILAYHHSVVLLKDCEFNVTGADPTILSMYNSIIMMWTGNTFPGGRETYSVYSGGAINWVYGLHINLVNVLGTPISDATICIEQSGGKERFVFKTDVDGHIINMYGLDVALLTWKHQYGSDKNVNFVYWSASSNSTYHTVTIFARGYEPYVEDIIMDADKTIDIVMKPAIKNRIINATIINSTIQ